MKAIFSNYQQIIILIIICLVNKIYAKSIPVWKEVTPNRDCGVNCLVIACKLLEKETDKREMATLSKCDQNGTNFYNMSNAIKQKGLFCKGVNWDLPKLKKWNSLAIAHWDNHFVLVQNVTNKEVRVIDPPKMPFNMPVNEFNKKWDGNLLLLSQYPINSLFTLQQLLLYTLGLLIVFLMIIFIKRHYDRNYRFQIKNSHKHITSVMFPNFMYHMLLES